MAASVATSIRPSLDNAEANVYIDKANSIAVHFNSSSLHIAQVQDVFDQKVKELQDVSATSITTKQNPAAISIEVDSQLSFLRKLKFNYLEQEAKDKYIKTIIDDDPEIITVHDNDSLRRSNEAKKARLKDAKDRLACRYKESRELSSNIETKYSKAKAIISELNTLTNQILDARLALSRFRTSHPLPRLSAASANAQLEIQTEQMAVLDEEVSTGTANYNDLKVKVQNIARDVERLKVERTAKEKEVTRINAAKNDKRISSLYDWFTTSLEFHSSLFSLISIKDISENELELNYKLEPPVHRLSNTTMGSPSPIPLALTLLFHPNTRVLADASVSSEDKRVAAMDLNELIGIHIQNNDIVGLIRAVMARVRTAT